jgi:hypothetical protein
VEFRLIRIRLDHPGYKNEQSVDDMVKAYAHNPVKIIESRRFNRPERVDARRLNQKMRGTAEYFFNLIGGLSVCCGFVRVNLSARMSSSCLP